LEEGSHDYLPGLAFNYSPSDLSLSSSCDYKCEPLVPRKTLASCKLPSSYSGLSPILKHIKLPTNWILFLFFSLFTVFPLSSLLDFFPHYL
jgi:hypothetical protein